MKKFLIAGMARSGTTTLGEILVSAGYDMWREPCRLKSRVKIQQYQGYQHLFNGVHYTPHGTLDFTDYSQEYTTNFMGKFFKHKDGIKHIINGTQVRITSGLVRAANRHKAAVIFMYRRNVWDSILSMMLAKETGIWQLINNGYDNLESCRSRFMQKLDNVTIDHRAFVKFLKSAHRDAIKTYNEISRVKADMAVYAYEDLYCDNEDRRRQQLNDILKFLEVDESKLDWEYTDKIYTKPTIKQTTSEVLEKITNINKLTPIKEKYSDFCTLDFE